MSCLELQFALAEVPEVPRALQFVRDSDWGATILSDGMYKVSGEIVFEGTVRRTGQNLLLELEVFLPVNFLCSRCGEEVSRDFNPTINHLFVQGKGDEVSLPVDVELDPELDISEFTGSQCDAEQVVLGALAADFPSYPECSGGCEVPSSGKTNLENNEPAIDPRLAPLLALRESMAQDPPATSNKV